MPAARPTAPPARAAVEDPMLGFATLGPTAAGGPPYSAAVTAVASQSSPDANCGTAIL